MIVSTIGQPTDVANVLDYWQFSLILNYEMREKNIVTSKF